jgi:4,5-dihydroxyphthalate decarboxylase
MSILKLRTLMAEYPHTAALKHGAVKSSLIEFEFTEIHPVWDGFKQVVKGDVFDAAELSIMTYLQARVYGKSLVALPVVMGGRMQHGQIVYNAERGELKPKDLEGRRVGVRSYPQTTPTWVRGILQNDFGVDLDKVNWVTFERGHVPEFSDPPNAKPAPAGKKMVDMLLSGEIDAAIMGTDAKYPQLKTVIPNPKAAGDAWYKKYGLLQVNHIFTVSELLAKSNPDAVKELYRMFVEGKKMSTEQIPSGGPDPRPLGITANRRNFELAAQIAWQQRLIPRQVTVDELFDDTTRVLGK